MKNKIIKPIAHFYSPLEENLALQNKVDLLILCEERLFLKKNIAIWKLLKA